MQNVKVEKTETNKKVVIEHMDSKWHSMCPKKATSEKREVERKPRKRRKETKRDRRGKRER